MTGHRDGPYVRGPWPNHPSDSPQVRMSLETDYFLFDMNIDGVCRLSLSPIMLPVSLHAQAVSVAEESVRSLWAVAERAFRSASEMAHYGFSSDVLELVYAAHERGEKNGLVRVDLLLGDDFKWRVCEVNADCPGGHNEAVSLPIWARKQGATQGANPTCVLDALTDHLAHLQKQQGGIIALMHATAYAEDMQVVALIEQSLRRRNLTTQRVSPLQLYEQNGSLYFRKERVGVLYRYYPVEYMEGQSNVSSIVTVMRAGRLATSSSFSHAVMQSKISLARLWSLLGILPESARKFTTDHCAETHLFQDVDAQELMDARASWVIKRALSRIGEHVYLGSHFTDEEWQLLLADVRADVLAGEGWIAQRFVAQRRLHTPSGEAYLTLGAYVLDGKFVGYLARLSDDSLATHDALCVPVFVDSIGLTLEAQPQ